MKRPAGIASSASIWIVGFLVAGPLSVVSAQPALKDVFADAFLIGAALNQAQFSAEDSRALPIIKKHFNTITAENVLKWGPVHPRPDEYNFEPADRFVDFGEENGLFVVGHTLVWHSQTPAWVFEDGDGNSLSREALLDRMRDHIHTVVGRYKGRIHGWDVVNEALNEDGTLRQTPWLRIIGEDYLAHAFRFAHEADPSAELYYNDYSLENAPKRNGAVRLVKGLLDQGVPVHGIGTQGHFKMDWPSVEQQDSTIRAFAALGVQVMVTELDIDVLPPVVRSDGADVSLRAEIEARQNPYVEGLPDSVAHAQAQRYAELFAVYLKHRDVVSRVTLWGVTDGDSWLNNWPARGRTSYPLLFDREGRPKPAFDAIVRTALNRE
jgi:endo-1,4-beta-xylanase